MSDSHELHQWFPSGNNPGTQGTSGNICNTDSCHNWGMEGSYRHVVEKVRAVAKWDNAQPLLTKNYPASNPNRANREKAKFQGSKNCLSSQERRLGKGRGSGAREVWALVVPNCRRLDNTLTASENWLPLLAPSSPTPLPTRKPWQSCSTVFLSTSSASVLFWNEPQTSSLSPVTMRNHWGHPCVYRWANSGSRQATCLCTQS